MKPTVSAKQVALAVAVATSAGTAHAKPPETITLSTSVHPMITGGTLAGCQMAFEVVREDFEYLNGAAVHLSGNLALVVSERGDLGAKLKLSIFNLNEKKSSAAPAEAYLVTGYRTNRADFMSSFEGDSGSRHFVYSPGNATITAIAGLKQDQVFTFAYSMKNGGLSAIVPVDAKIQKLNLDSPEDSAIGNRTVDDWSRCVTALIDVAEMRNGSPE